MRAIVTGMIASYPVGGVLWDYGQYALGLEEFGWEVYYLEDTGWQTYDPARGEYGEDPSYGVRFLSRSLAELSPTLGERWHFRSMNGESFGMSRESLLNALAGTDLFLNVSGSALLRDEYMQASCKALIDSDPGWNHFVNYPKWDENPGWQGAHGYRAHDVFFTYAERMGQPDCLLPDLGIVWKPTRPLVVSDCWKSSKTGDRWTTVMTWDNFRRPITHNGAVYGTKEKEFVKIEATPARVSANLEIAVGGDHAPRERWRELGWSVVDSHARSATADDYREYIQQSRGEFSVAKNVYVATRSGWFSCRSICYLAAGKPVVVQETGFSDLIPSGRGVVAFSDGDEAVGALESVEGNYALHSQAAREITREHFDHRVVLGQLLGHCGLN